MPATRSNAYIAGIAFVVLFVGSISLVLIGGVHQIVSPILNSESAKRGSLLGNEEPDF